MTIDNLFWNALYDETIDLDYISSLIDQGVDLNKPQIPGVGDPPLFCALRLRYFNLIKLFISKGADINIQERAGNTLLHAAVNTCEVDLLILLLQFGADMDVKNNKGLTPFNIAVMGKNKVMANIMLAERFRRFKEELDRIPAFLWGPIELWIINVKETIKQNAPDFLEGFNEVACEPQWFIGPKTFNFPDRRPQIKRTFETEKSYRAEPKEKKKLPSEDEVNLSQAESQKSKLLGYMDTVIGLISQDIHSAVEIPKQMDKVDIIAGYFSSYLRKMTHQTPESEKDIQDNVERILIAKGLKKGIDYDRETGRTKFSIKEDIPDFTLLKLNCAVEVKFSKDRNRAKAIVKEMSTDIISYKKKYKRIIFIVYDLGTIQDVDEFVRDFEDETGVKALVIKH